MNDYRDGFLTSAQAAAYLGKSLKAFSNYRERRRKALKPIPEYRFECSRELFYRPEDLQPTPVAHPTVVRAVPRAFLKSHRRTA